MSILIERADFKDLIPQPTAEEREQLEKLLLAEGCRDAIVTWNGTIVDGHNRYALCQKHGIPFETVERDFVDENAAKIWIVENQFGRRNLSQGQRAALAIKLGTFEEVAAAAAERRGGRPQKDGAHAPHLSRAPKTNEIVAEKAGVGATTIRYTKYVQEHDPAVFQKVLQGELTARGAHQQVRERVERSAATPPQKSAGPAPMTPQINIERRENFLPNWCSDIVVGVLAAIHDQVVNLESTTKPWEGNLPVNGHYLRQIRAAQLQLRAVHELLCFPVLPHEKA